MTSASRISIIIPSYNDARIERAIASVRLFDDIDSVRIVVMDGGSSQHVLDLIQEALTDRDFYVSETDRGIFDALNKGLDTCNTDYIGWLGSDDFYTGHLRASEVIALLQNADILVANAVHFTSDLATRVTHSFPSRLGLAKFGLHNPHFATFGSARLLKSERFDTGLRGADIDYFLRIFAKKPRVVTVSRVATLIEEGGFSNSSLREIVRTNFELVSVYARHVGWLFSPFPVLVKLGYKGCSNLFFKLRRRGVPSFHA